MSQLGIKTESFGAGDQSWLGSRLGADYAKSATLNPSAWTGKTTDGRIKSGEPFAMVDGLAVPYNGGASNGTQILAGFILTDRSVRTGGGNVTFPAVWTGRIIIDNLPSTVAANATTSGQFVLESEEEGS